MLPGCRGEGGLRWQDGGKFKQKHHPEIEKKEGESVGCLLVCWESLTLSFGCKAIRWSIRPPFYKENLEDRTKLWAAACEQLKYIQVGFINDCLSRASNSASVSLNLSLKQKQISLEDIRNNIGLIPGPGTSVAMQAKCCLFLQNDALQLSCYCFRL